MVTPGHINVRNRLKSMAKYIKEKLFGDKGYISKALQEQLWDQGIRLITQLRRNMKKVVLVKEGTQFGLISQRVGLRFANPTYLATWLIRPTWLHPPK
ncbi:MAG: hypothetical protein HC877_07220 [Thioploca sp.]|nr:hypothetical protein [Thioploca sp.]